MGAAILTNICKAKIFFRKVDPLFRTSTEKPTNGAIREILVQYEMGHQDLNMFKNKTKTTPNYRVSQKTVLLHFLAKNCFFKNRVKILFISDF